MRSNWKIGSILGIPLYIDPSWLFILLFITWINVTEIEQKRLIENLPLLTWGFALLMALLLFASVLLHELGHSLVARFQGITVNSITLFLFGGIAAIDRESKTPLGAFLVALAGPAVSFALFVICSGITHIIPLSSLWKYGILDLARINLTLGIFNLIPGLPLDGGQMLKAIVWQISGDRFKGIHWASQSGKLVGSFGIALGLLLFLLTGVFSAAWIALIGWFVLRNADAYDRLTTLQESLLKLVAADAMTRDFRVVNAKLTLRQFAEEYIMAQDTYPKTYFAAADGRYRGLVRVQDFQQIERSQWERIILADIAHPLSSIISIPEKATLAATINRLEQSGDNRIVVLSPAGAVAGIIDRGDIVRAIATAKKLPISQNEINKIKLEGNYPDYFPLPEIAKGLDSG